MTRRARPGVRAAASALALLAGPALLAGGWALVACAFPFTAPAAAKIPGVQVVTGELLRALAAAQSQLPSLPGVPAIRNCAQLLAAVDGGVDLAERIESPLFGAYSTCVAGALVEGGAGTSGASRLELTQAGAQIMAHLDLSSVRSSLAQRRPAEHYFLSDFAFASSHVQPLSVELESDSFDYRIDVLAVGDFTRAGQREWLVRFVERARAGTYNSSRILVLAWPRDHAAMTARDGLDVLRTRSR